MSLALDLTPDELAAAATDVLLPTMCEELAGLVGMRYSPELLQLSVLNAGAATPRSAARVDDGYDEAERDGATPTLLLSVSAAAHSLELIEVLRDPDAVGVVRANLTKAATLLGKPAFPLRRIGVATEPRVHRAEPESATQQLQRARRAHKKGVQLLGKPEMRPAKQRGFGVASWEWCQGALEVLRLKGIVATDDVPCGVPATPAAAELAAPAPEAVSEQQRLEAEIKAASLVAAAHLATFAQPRGVSKWLSMRAETKQAQQQFAEREAATRDAGGAAKRKASTKGGADKDKDKDVARFDDKTRRSRLPPSTPPAEKEAKHRDASTIEIMMISRRAHRSAAHARVLRAARRRLKAGVAVEVARQRMVLEMAEAGSHKHQQQQQHQQDRQQGESQQQQQQQQQQAGKGLRALERSLTQQRQTALAHYSPRLQAHDRMHRRATALMRAAGGAIWATQPPQRRQNKNHIPPPPLPGSARAALPTAADAYGFELPAMAYLEGSLLCTIGRTAARNRAAAAPPPATASAGHHRASSGAGHGQLMRRMSSTGRAPPSYLSFWATYTQCAALRPRQGLDERGMSEAAVRAHAKAMGLQLDNDSATSLDYCGVPLVLIAAVTPLPPGWREGLLDADGRRSFVGPGGEVSGAHPLAPMLRYLARAEVTRQEASATGTAEAKLRCHEWVRLAEPAETDASGSSPGQQGQRRAGPLVWCNLRTGERCADFPSSLCKAEERDSIYRRPEAWAKRARAVAELFELSAVRPLLEALDASAAEQAETLHKASRALWRRPRVMLEVLHAAELLGIDPLESPELVWLAEEALSAELPLGWDELRDVATGVNYYHNPILGLTQWQHPKISYLLSLRVALSGTPRARR